jgi:hypothetical protein
MVTEEKIILSNKATLNRKSVPLIEKPIAMAWL